MHGPNVYKKSRRGSAAGDHDMRRSVTLSKQGRLKGQFRVRMCGVHVVDDV